MKFGLGKLQWSPKIFWSATVIELRAAADGLSEFYGGEGAELEIKPLTSEEFDELKEKLEGADKSKSG